MRAHGQVTEVPVAGAHDHVCWVYRDEAELAAAALEFLAGGLARGEQLLCVGDRVVDGLHRDRSALGGIDALIAAGVLRTSTVAEAYASTGGFSAERQQAFYDDATRQALAEGFRGLRVLAEVSVLAGDPRTQPELLRWEQVADDYVAHGPGMTAMCAYREDLPEQALREAAGVHPLVHSPGSPPDFQAFFDDHRVALVGEVDVLGAERLARVLAVSPVAGGGCTLDLSGLRFADVAGCRAIARWARGLADRGIRVELRNAPPLVRRAWHLLGLDEWVPVTFTSTA